MSQNVPKMFPNLSNQIVTIQKTSTNFQQFSNNKLKTWSGMSISEVFSNPLHPLGNFQKVSRKRPAKILDKSWKCSKEFLRISWKKKGICTKFTGIFPEIFRQFPGRFPDISRKFPGSLPDIPGHFPDISRKVPGSFPDIPGHFPDISWNVPGKFPDFW